MVDKAERPGSTVVIKALVKPPLDNWEEQEKTYVSGNSASRIIWTPDRRSGTSSVAVTQMMGQESPKYS